MIIRGAFIILFASFVWGIGNAVTGLTAREYLSSGSLFPAVDIALSNTFGGLFFLIVISFLRNWIYTSPAIKENNQKLVSLKKGAILAGTLKGANTCFFVFSTTFIFATQSLILESTYIVWSLLLAITFLPGKVPLIPTILKTLLLCLGVILVSGQTNLQFSSGYQMFGSIFGILAGLSYAFFLFFWSSVTENLTDLKSQLRSTSILLIISLLTIILLTEVFSIFILRRWWIPLTNLRFLDVFLQVTNGAFVVGFVYLLVTIGMTKLKKVPEGAGFVAATCLSFSIPFTLLPEFAFGKFLPSGSQFAGIFLFMFGFVLMSTGLSRTPQTSPGPKT
ncbi:MAG: hypothetical protein HY033_10180 [Ignavibacteriae bacterium]|nr:hypothetical protein [Ignavibacteria bacterium]MBI3365263.1 hypothetical protein [Ignavibacteriota bacterium]